MTRRNRPRVLRRVIDMCATLLVAGAVLALIGLTIAPRVLDYRTATMLTGSMAPVISPGDVIVDVPEAPAHLAVGQIVTYHIPVQDHRVESHRVIWIHRHNGVTLFRTRGDANTGADPWTAQVHGDQVWVVQHVVPWVGSVIRALRTPAVHLLLGMVAPVLLVLAAFAWIWRPRRLPEPS